MTNYGITGYNGHGATCACAACCIAEEAERSATRKAIAQRPGAYWTNRPTEVRTAQCR